MVVSGHLACLQQSLQHVACLIWLRLCVKQRGLYVCHPAQPASLQLERVCGRVGLCLSVESVSVGDGQQHGKSSKMLGDSSVRHGACQEHRIN